MERASKDPEYRKELDATWSKKFLNKKDPATDVSPADKVRSWGDFSFPTDKMEDLKMKARAFVDNYKGTLGRIEEKKQLDYQNDGINSYSNAEYSSNIQ